MICDEDVLRNLMDAGCGEEMVVRYQSLADETMPEEVRNKKQERMLRGYRREILDRLHDEQHRLACLDYLLYRLRESREGLARMQQRG